MSFYKLIVKIVNEQKDIRKEKDSKTFIIYLHDCNKIGRYRENIARMF